MPRIYCSICLYIGGAAPTHWCSHSNLPCLCSCARQMVNLLLTKGANINAFDKKDGRALHWAAFMGMEPLSDGSTGLL